MHHGIDRRGFRLSAALVVTAVVVSVLWFAGRSGSAEEGPRLSSQKLKEKLKERETQAAKLVEEALRLRAAGDTAKAREQLTQAVSLAPDHAPARWQLGEIRRDGEWTGLEEIVPGAVSNADLAEYTRQRDALIRIAAPLWMNNLGENPPARLKTPRYSQVRSTAVRYLRKTIELTGKPEWAQLKLQIVGKCDVSINGRAAIHAEGIGWSGVKVVTAQLHSGANVIALTIHAFTDQQVPGVRAWLEGVEHDHAIFTVATDESWKVSADKADGWRDPQFDDSGWESAAVATTTTTGDAFVTDWPVSTKLETTLARWCQEHALPEQSRFHWTRVLQVQPDNGEAIKALGLRAHDGRLLTKAQIDEAKRDEREAIAAMARWSPILQKLYVDLARGAGKSADVQRKKLQDADATAIPAFERVLGEAAATDGSPAFVTEFIAAVLVRCQDPAATALLSNIARTHAGPTVRRTAIEALKGRDLLTFVPDLMGALQSPTLVTTSVTTDNKAAICTAKYFQVGIFSDEERIETNRYEPESKEQNSEKAYRRAVDQEQKIKLRVETENLRIPERNEPILAILRAVTQTDQGETAAAWWKWWGEHNELLIPTHNRLRQVSYYNTEIIRSERMRIKDCFAKGTLVWTQGGLRPIETIRVGDTVLAQDVEKGELAFKIVLGTSIRPASPMTSVRVGGETIVSTRGHRYWVDGTGWRMAKNLKAGDSLHGMKERLSVEDVSESPDLPAWNLIVDGFNSYFVGQQGILVHDSGVPRPTTSIVPGLPR